MTLIGKWHLVFRSNLALGLDGHPVPSGQVLDYVNLFRMPFTDSGLWIPRKPRKRKSTFRTALAATYDTAVKLTPIIIALAAFALSYLAYVTTNELTILQNQAWVRPDGHIKVELVKDYYRPYNSDVIEFRAVAIEVTLANWGNAVATKVGVRVCEISKENCPAGLSDTFEIPGKGSKTVRESFIINPTDPEWRIFSPNDSTATVVRKMEITYSDRFRTAERLSYSIYVRGDEVRSAQHQPIHSDL
jgi:hypothetical protein